MTHLRALSERATHTEVVSHQRVPLIHWAKVNRTSIDSFLELFALDPGGRRETKL